MPSRRVLALAENRFRYAWLVKLIRKYLPSLRGMYRNNSAELMDKVIEAEGEKNRVRTRGDGQEVATRFGEITVRLCSRPVQGESRRCLGNLSQRRRRFLKQKALEAEGNCPKANVGACSPSVLSTRQAARYVLALLRSTRKNRQKCWRSLGVAFTMPV